MARLSSDGHSGGEGKPERRLQHPQTPRVSELVSVKRPLLTRIGHVDVGTAKQGAVCLLPLVKTANVGEMLVKERHFHLYRHLKSFKTIQP